MAKRKAVIANDEDDDDEFIASDEEKPKLSINQRKGKAVKEDKADELESDEGRPLAKKVKTEKRPNRDQSASAEDGTDVVVRCTSDGDKYIDLGKKKRATVRSYKGNVFVDIREFYGADGDEKPGKKGVSLNLDQWEALKRSSDAIDHLFTEQKK